MSTKQQSAERTRTRLVDAAMATIHAQGLVGLTLDGVAKAAGVSKGGLLHHFPSKDALVEAILRRLFADFDAWVRHYLEREPVPPAAGSAPTCAPPSTRTRSRWSWARCCWSPRRRMRHC